MNIIIAGGGKEHRSGIVNKLQGGRHKIWKFNGYTNYKKFSKDVQLKIDEVKPHIIIWMADAKKAPILNRPSDSLLIYGKYAGYKENVHNIFASQAIISKMKADGVVLFKPIFVNFYRLELVDKLGNYWEKSKNLNKFIKAIVKLRNFYNEVKCDTTIFKPRLAVPQLPHRLDIITEISNNLAIQIGMYYTVEDLTTFNLDYTRLYPSIRERGGCFVSKQNIPDNFIEKKDMVYVEKNTHFNPFIKCPIDTSLHLEIYNRYPNINYIIHGHAYIKDASFTSKYYSCGDKNSIEDLGLKTWGLLNLKNHGFLIYAGTLQQLTSITRHVEVLPKLPEKLT